MSPVTPTVTSSNELDNDVDNIVISSSLTKNLLGKASKKGTNLGYCPKFGYPLPPSEFGTSLSEDL